MMRKLLNLLGDILIISGIFILAAWVCLLLAGNKLYVVPTGSMEPNIHRSSIVIVNAKESYAEIKKGDVVVYKRSDGLDIIHRVVSGNLEDGFTVRGDANEHEDSEKVTLDNFEGKFIFAIPKVGWIFEENRNLLVAAIALFTIILNALPSKKGRRKQGRTQS